MTGLRVAIAAEESAGVQALKLVAESGHDPLLVLTTGGGPVASAADELGVPVGPAESVTEPSLADRLERESADLLLNVHSLHVVQGAVLGAPAIGAFNLHPGPLPEYAGLNVTSWAIYRGERRHAVTLHWMAPQIDAGPIAYAEFFEISPEDTGLSLTVTCARRGMGLIARLLADAALDPARIPADEQDMNRRRYFGAGPPDGGRMAWSSPARRLADLIRASDYLPFESPWGLPHTRLGDERIEIAKASLSGMRADAAPGTVGPGPGESVTVAAGDEWLVVDRVIAGGRARPAAAVLEPGERLDRASSQSQGPPGVDDADGG